MFRNTYIRSSTFKLNIANKDGGAIKWKEKKPEIDDSTNIYSENQAVFGPDIASYPIKMGLEIIEKSSNKIVYSSKLSSNIAELLNISAGNAIQYRIVVKILDYYDNIVYSENGFLKIFFFKLILL